MVLQANAHIGFNCKNLNQTVKFYEEILGCQEKFTLCYGDLIPSEPERLAQMKQSDLERLRELKNVRWIVYLEWTPGTFIELFNEVDAHLDNPYSPENYGFTHFGIVVEDIQKFYQELVAKGACKYIDLLPSPTIDRNWSMWFHDPEGNRIEALEYGAQAMQKLGRGDGL